MTIKRILSVLVTMFMVAGLASAQVQSISDESLEFNPHAFIQLQGGGSHTIGEAAFKDLNSPAAFLNIGGEFTPVFGARVGVGGWQGKGNHCASGTLYKFNFVQANGDVLFNFSNLIGGYKHDRVVSVIPFVGIGGFFGIKNDEVQALPTSSKDIMEYVWQPTKAMFLGRGGIIVDFRLGDHVSLNIEGNVNSTSDHLNSKKAGNPDWTLNALAGLKINLGSSTRTSAAWLAAQEAAAAAAAAAAEAERLAAEKAAAEAAAKAAAEKAAAEAAAKAAAEKAAAEAAAAAARAKICEENSINVFFTIDKANIRKSEIVKLEALTQFLKANDDYAVELVGYADRPTGYPAYNQKLSEKRAAAVKKYLVEHGVAPEKIISDAKGDTIQPFDKQEMNRVVICTVE